MYASLVLGQEYGIVLNLKLFLYHFNIMEALSLLFEYPDYIQILFDPCMNLLLNIHNFLVLFRLAAPQKWSTARLVVKHGNPCTEGDLDNLQLFFVLILEDLVLAPDLVEIVEGGEDAPECRITSIKGTADLQENSVDTTHGRNEVHE